MTIASFKGFGAIRLEADIIGNEHDPAILLVHGPGQDRSIWREVADGLVQSGRRVVILDLRGHGGSECPEDGRYDLAANVEDLRAVLAQMGSRPVVVTASMGGWFASLALATDATNLAAGLVLVDMPFHPVIEQPDAPHLEQELLQTAPGLNLPTMVVRGGIAPVLRSAESDAFDAALPNAEIVEVEDADILEVTDRSEALLARLLDFLERKQPRRAAEFRAGSDARTLRDAMGCFATGVTIVTALSDAGVPVGLTANSFTSVSLDPPLLLVCIANSAGTAPILRQARHFGVNVLQTAQQPASNRFAGKGEDRFAATAWGPGESGVPLLDGSLVSFECRQHAVHEGGDHFLLVGEVVRAQFEPRRDPLLYFRGKYRRLHFA